MQQIFHKNQSCDSGSVSGHGGSSGAWPPLDFSKICKRNHLILKKIFKICGIKRLTEPPHLLIYFFREITNRAFSEPENFDALKNEKV